MRRASLALCLFLAATTTHADEAFEPLLDGESLAGWRGASDAWEAADGVLATRPDGVGDLYTDEEYGDFVLRFEFRLTPGANNGVALRAPGEGDAAYAGMECQVLDNTAPKYADLQPYQYHGSIYGVVAAERGHLRPVGEWNQQEIRCDGRRVRVTLNGVAIVDADLDQAAPDGETIDGRDHPGLARSGGRIGLLAHSGSGRVEFRRLAVRLLGAGD